MSIQSNINQSLSIAAFLAQGNPSLKARAQNRKELKAFTEAQTTRTEAKDIVGAAASALARKRPRTDEGKAANLEARAEKSEELAGISKEMIAAQEKEFKRNPTPEGYAEIGRLKKGLAGEEKKALSLRDKAEVIRKRSNESLSVAQDEMRANKSIVDMLKGEPTSWGVKVGDFSPNLQKIIESAYKEDSTK